FRLFDAGIGSGQRGSRIITVSLLFGQSGFRRGNSLHRLFQRVAVLVFARCKLRLASDEFVVLGLLHSPQLARVLERLGDAGGFGLGVVELGLMLLTGSRRSLLRAVMLVARLLCPPLRGNGDSQR